MINKKDWRYYDEDKNEWTQEWFSLNDLKRLYENGVVEDSTSCGSRLMFRRRGPGSQPIAYSQIARLEVDFVPDIEVLFESRSTQFVTILCGPNNCGKTLLLKQLYAVAGESAYLVACNRFSSIDILNTRQQEESQYQNYYTNFLQSSYTSRQNTEDTEFKLEQAITSLSNVKRDQLFAICKDILGNSLSLKRTQPDNEFSPFYVDMDGENLRYGSTGTRLLITLLGALLNERFKTLLIDEPEIGLSPRSQTAIAKLLFDPQNRAKYWPHLVQLYIATHSHLLLDSQVFGNNYAIRKTGNVVSAKQLQSVGEFHQLQFNMLGNEFESVFLPSAIVLVEGDSDVTFLTRCFALKIANRKIAVVRAGGDGAMLEKLHVLRETFGDIATNPYRTRIFVWLDSKHSVKVPRLEGAGVLRENILVSSKNGIEYQYPQMSVATMFRCTVDQIQRIDLEADPIEFNGIRKSKKELAQLMSESLTTQLEIGIEIQNLVCRIISACN